MPYNPAMFSFIETRLFTKLVLGYMTDDEYLALQTALMTDPEAGPVVPGFGGVRKLRWAAQGRGKRRGYRVIYYVRRVHGVLDAHDVSEERLRQHSCSRTPADPEGS
jgi:mRNA-degrading endonuclease RelE of RelBE toxin-antitoxin system